MAAWLLKQSPLPTAARPAVPHLAHPALGDAVAAGDLARAAGGQGDRQALLGGEARDVQLLAAVGSGQRPGGLEADAARQLAGGPRLLSAPNSPSPLMPRDSRV